MLLVSVADTFLRISMGFCIVQACCSAQNVLLFTVSQFFGMILRTIIQRQVFGLKKFVDNLAPSFSTLVGKEEVKY